MHLSIASVAFMYINSKDNIRRYKCIDIFRPFGISFFKAKILENMYTIFPNAFHQYQFNETAKMTSVMTNIS